MPRTVTARQCFEELDAMAHLEKQYILSTLLPVFVSKYLAVMLQGELPIMYCPYRPKRAWYNKKARRTSNTHPEIGLDCLNRPCMHPLDVKMRDSDYNLLSFWLLCLGLNKTGGAVLQTCGGNGDVLDRWLIDASQLMEVQCPQGANRGWLSLSESAKGMKWANRSGVPLERAKEVLNDAMRSQGDLTTAAMELMGSSPTSLAKMAIDSSCAKMLCHAKCCITEMLAMHKLHNRCNGDCEIVQQLRSPTNSRLLGPESVRLESDPEYGPPQTPEAQRCGQKTRRMDGIEPHRWLSMQP